MKKLSIIMFLALFFLIPIFALADAIVLGPSDFDPYRDETYFRHSTAHLYVPSGSPNSLFYAPVHLPDGVQITSVGLFYKDDSATGNIRITLYKKNIYTQASIPMAVWISYDDSPSILSHKISPIVGGGFVNNTGYFYHVRIYFDDASADDDCIVHAVKIIYQ